jgi:hypothetical protein
MTHPILSEGRRPLGAEHKEVDNAREPTMEYQKKQDDIEANKPTDMAKNSASVGATSLPLQLGSNAQEVGRLIDEISASGVGTSQDVEHDAVPGPETGQE